MLKEQFSKDRGCLRKELLESGKKVRNELLEGCGSDKEEFLLGSGKWQALRPRRFLLLAYCYEFLNC